MKRQRSDDHDHSITMANCLMLLSEAATATFVSSSSSTAASTGRVFICKTCNRQFSSFQALGGHRASHKKPRTTMAGEDSNSNSDDSSSSPAKPKTHECSICGLEFAIGQALGGHMRRHRAPITSHNNNNSNSSSSSSVEFDSDTTKKKKKKSSKRVLFLDLNLTPLENDLQILGIGTSTPLLVTL